MWLTTTKFLPYKEFQTGIETKPNKAIQKANKKVKRDQRSEEYFLSRKAVRHELRNYHI